MTDNRFSIRAIVAIGLMTALTAIGAWIRIPMPYLPFTLQMTFVYLSGVCLGSRNGAIAQTIYVVAGLVGFPIFAEGGGPHYLFKPSFGYLLGFIIAAWSSGTITQNTDKYYRYILGAISALVVTYIPGIFWLFIALKHFVGQSTDMATAVKIGIAPLPKDLILVPLNAYLGMNINKLRNAGNQN